MRPARLILCATAAPLALALGLASAARAELPSQKLLTLEVAQAIAQGALDQCRKDGHKVTVTVVDHANVLKALLRDDGASAGTVEIGRMKANSVMAFGRPSGPPGGNPPGQMPPPPILPGTVNFAGGLPITVAGQLIGAVSVSGAPGSEKDVACAEAGLAKVAEKLK
jgi:uncharacterized protein GlcG (DUF336 family)